MKKIVLSISAIMAFSSSVYALGTDAATQINNSATLSYSAGGVAQPEVTSNTDSFVVDKKIDMILTTTDSDQIEVTPGQTNKITSYSFKNEGNSNENFKFEVTNLTNGKEADYNNKKDNEDAKNLRIEYSTDGGSSWNSLPSDGIVNVDEDTTIDLRVKADIPNPDNTPGNNDAGAGDDGDIMNVELKATAYKDDKSGAEVETTSSDTQNKVDVVFADGESVQNGATSSLGSSSNDKGDVAGDGKDVARSGYIIKTPVLSVVKSSCVVSDPVNNTTNPKRIPGAVIRYMFDITNSGSAKVSGLKINDSLNANLDLSNSKSSAKKDEDVDSCSCSNEPSTSISADTTVNKQDISINNIDISSSKHACVSFEVEIK